MTDLTPLTIGIFFIQSKIDKFKQRQVFIDINEQNMKFIILNNETKPELQVNYFCKYLFKYINDQYALYTLFFNFYL
jgi:hypothetical protein